MLDAAYQWNIGLVLVIIGAIWGFLFVNPRSPVRKYCWSVSGKLGVVLIYNGRHNVGVGDSYLSVYVGLRALSDVQVDKINLRIMRKRLLSDWKPKVIQGDNSQIINFPRPSWLHRGEYEAYLIAYTPDGFSKSEKFLVKVDK